MTSAPRPSRRGEDQRARARARARAPSPQQPGARGAAAMLVVEDSRPGQLHAGMTCLPAPVGIVVWLACYQQHGTARHTQPRPLVHISQSRSRCALGTSRQGHVPRVSLGPPAVSCLLLELPDRRAARITHRSTRTRPLSQPQVVLQGGWAVAGCTAAPVLDQCPASQAAMAPLEALGACLRMSAVILHRTPHRTAHGRPAASHQGAT